MKTVDLASSDRTFIRQVEEESGQVVSRCYQCGNCTAGCPMNFAYDFPVHRIMRLIQTGQKDTVLKSKSLAYCATCETCTARCPNNIDVATIMDVCRHMARREGYRGEWPVRMFTNSFLKTVQLFGRTHEVGTMAGFMLTAFRPFTDLDLVPKVVPKNKLPILPHTIKGRKEVAEIFRRFKEGEHEKE
ncbi:4Fe-4S dicluster domain-containing protein [Desulfovibrio sp. OttesenSCG-928-O18]|nr:4Fe-4S dicluster domain-containing protein [Desulfovibrio sp. OttesenSCG-928-O18]